MIQALVHVVDDDQAVRDSLTMLLEAADLPARAYPDAETFLAQLGTAPATVPAPGCVVADVRMPGLSGLDLLRLLQERGVGLPLIVITGHADVAMAVQALKAGAADFIEKPFDDETFLNSVRDALDQGERSFRRRQRREQIETRARTLTPRENEVMARVVRGLPNKAVAADLSISVRTVEIHRARVMEKMRADSLSALVRMALELEPSPRG